MSREVTWEESKNWVPEVHYGTPPIYHPEVKTSPELKSAVLNLGGAELMTAYGYGSSFFNSAGPDSLIDLVLLVNDPRKFYEDLLDRRPEDMGVKDAAWNAHVSTINPNFHRGVLDVAGKPVQVKYGVTGERDFWKFARGGRKDAHQSGEGKGFLYTAGRVQKAALVPLYSRYFYDQGLTDQAINQARVDGIWLALGLMPDEFTTEQLIKTYISLSYKADLRVEKPTKVQSIYSNNELDYHRMFGTLMVGFEDKFVVDPLDDVTFKKRVSLSPQDVQGWLNEAKIWSATMNYAKNPLVWGISGGIEYALAKVKRVVNS